MRHIDPIIMITALLFLTFFNSCNKALAPVSNYDCKDIMCTQEFKTIAVTIKDQDQNPVTLDSYKVTHNNKDLTTVLSESSTDLTQGSGQYLIATDRSLNVNQENKVKFKGYINGQEVINNNYTVSKDCCHISLVNGELQITL